MATHSSILAWRIPGMGEPGGLPSVGSHRVGQSPAPGVHSDSCPSSQRHHPTISSSVTPFSSCLQSFPASGPFTVNQLFASGGQSIGTSASASVLPMNTQDRSPLEWTGWISLQSMGLSRVFSNTTVQKHQFFSTQLSSHSLLPPELCPACPGLQGGCLAV